LSSGTPANSRHYVGLNKICHSRHLVGKHAAGMPLKRLELGSNSQ
jgi:hypothetical protein